MAMGIRVVGDEEGKGDEAGNGVGNDDGDEGGGRQRGNGDGGKSNGDKDNGGRQAMAMATKRGMVTVMATRVSEGGGRRNRHWQQQQEQWRR